MNKFLSILLPHSDDELFVLPFIERKLTEGYKIHIFYITTDMNVKRRNESQEMFSHFKNIEIHHFGQLNNILDGKLNEQNLEAQILLEKNTILKNSELLITPILEGGHTDHDAIFKIGYNLSIKFNKPLLCFSLYNAYRTPFVRVSTMYQGPAQGDIETITFSFFKGLKYLKKGFYYKSQIIILAVLFPGLVRTFLLKRKIEILWVNSFDSEKKHPGRIFYESNLKVKLKTFLGI